MATTAEPSFWTQSSGYLASIVWTTLRTYTRTVVVYMLAYEY
jgi:hypothetical protein